MKTDSLELCGSHLRPPSPHYVQNTLTLRSHHSTLGESTGRGRLVEDIDIIFEQHGKDAAASCNVTARFVKATKGRH
jgi:hypothetical protein